MGASKYILSTMQEEYKKRNDLLREKIAKWRKEGSIVRVKRPTNIARAHQLGYKAKQGVIIVRVMVRKGSSKREKPDNARTPARNGRFFNYRKSAQAIAEERAARKYRNCEVLNSYYVGEDGVYKFYEVILLDRAHPSITNDNEYKHIVDKKGRAFRGLTRAGRKHRGILNKGFGSYKNRPSKRSVERL